MATADSLALSLLGLLPRALADWLAGFAASVAGGLVAWLGDWLVCFGTRV